MSRRTITTCDCCDRELQPEEYYIELKPSYFMQGRSGEVREYKEDFEWYICSECLEEIGKRIAEKANVDFKVEESK